MSLTIRIGLIIGLLTAYTGGVWHVRGWYDASQREKELLTRLEVLKDGQAKVLDFSQAWAKATGGKQPCALPPDARKLLK